MFVDSLGRAVGDVDNEEYFQTLIGCDQCAGLDDNEDYNDDGLPDCVDPPWRSICPDESEMVQGVGLVLRFFTGNLDEEDYPEPVKFQSILSSSGILYQANYLTIDFVREIEENGQIITEIVYSHDTGDYVSEDFMQVQIVYSDYQTCLLEADDFMPLPCPFYVNVLDELLKFESESGNLDVSEIFGVFVFDDGVNRFEFNASTYPSVFVGNQLWFNSLGVGLNDEFQDDFNGVITLPSGLVCPIDSVVSETCNLGDIDITPGTLCDDTTSCTHHDKYITQADG